MTHPASSDNARLYSFTRGGLATALTRLEIKIRLYSPETLKVDAVSMADAIIGALGEGSESPAIELLKDALFLRMNGERPPGHSEATWRKWEREAEVFLRSLLPPDPEGEEL